MEGRVLDPRPEDQIRDEGQDSLTSQERSLLERAQQALAENPAPPIMSHPESGNVYAGPDADPAPTGVDIADSPVHVLPQGEGNRY